MLHPGPSSLWTSGSAGNSLWSPSQRNSITTPPSRSYISDRRAPPAYFGILRFIARWISTASKRLACPTTSRVGIARRRAPPPPPLSRRPARHRSEEHTPALHSLIRTSYAVFCFNTHTPHHPPP